MSCFDIAIKSVAMQSGLPKHILVKLSPSWLSQYTGDDALSHPWMGIYLFSLSPLSMRRMMYVLVLALCGLITSELLESWPTGSYQISEAVSSRPFLTTVVLPVTATDCS
jgi:hypothetical protein